MNHILIRSTLFSVGVHTFLLMPLVSGGWPFSLPKTDVVRGQSSIELELVSLPQPPNETGEEPSEPLRPAAEPLVSDDGAFSRLEPTGLDNPAPRYPWAARLQGWEGTALLQVVVTPSGLPERIQVKKSTGHPVLDHAAVSALQQWRFLPARRDGRAVSATVVIPVTFKLENKNEIPQTLGPRDEKRGRVS